MSGVRSARASWRVAAALVGVLAVAGCTGDDDPVGPSATSTSDASPTSAAAPQWSAEDLIEAGRPTEETILASIEGELAYQEVPIPARFDVLAVDAGEAATVLRLRMTVLGSGGDVVAENQYLSPDATKSFDIRGIALQVPEQNIRFQPTLAARTTNPAEDALCLCSALSEWVDPATPFYFTATFPALDPATTTVDLELVGFPLVTGIPVDHS